MVLAGLLVTLLSRPAGPTAAPSAILGVDATDFPSVSLFLDTGDGAVPTAQDTTVLESGKAASVSAVQRAGSWTIMLVLDDASSPRAAEEPLRAALSRLAAELPEGTRAGMVIAGDALRLLPPTADWEERAQAGLTFAASRARVLDGVVLAAHALQDRKGPRAVIVVRAGGDVASQTDRETARLWAARAGVPIWDISLSGEPDIEIAALEAASGARPLAAEDGADPVAALALALAGACRVEYMSPSPLSRGQWVEVEIPAVSLGRPSLKGGYAVPPGDDADWFVPRIACPVPLEALPVLLYDETGRHFRAWTLAGRALRLQPGRYRCVAATRPRTERVVDVGGGTSEALIAWLGALTLDLPACLPAALNYRITSERTRAPVAIGRAGEPTPLPPGSYGIQLLGDASLQRSAIGVAAGGSTALDLSGWATVTVRLADATGSPAAAEVTLARGDESYTGAANSPMLVPAGEWTATVETRPAESLGTVTAVPGEAVEVALPPLGALTVDLLRSDGQPAREAWVTAERDDPARAASGVTGVATSLPAGRYAITVLTSPPLKLEAVVRSGEAATISAGRLVALTLSIDGHDAQPRALKYSLVESATGDRVASGVTGRPLEIRPGTYDLDVWTFPHLIVSEMEVAEGADAHIALGSLGALSLDAPRQVRLGAYRLSDEGEVPAVTLDGGETVELLPGTYETRALEPAGFGYTERIVVGGGEVSRLRIAAADLPGNAEEDVLP